jgi:hypothetical protein
MIPMNRLAVCAFGSLLAALGAGCGDGKEGVRGAVTLDGQPVKTGTITFVSSEGSLIREGAVITNGAFTARVPPGKYKVELNAQHVVGTRKQLGFDGKEEELTLSEELFPDHFNSKTELTEVISSGGTIITLNLKSKK